MPFESQMRQVVASIMFAAVVTPFASGEEACFTARSNEALPFEVIRASPPPGAAATGFTEFPLTAAATRNLERIKQADPDIKTYYFLWANRCHDLDPRDTTCRSRQKGNPVRFQGTTSKDLRVFFSTVDKADACSLVQASVVLGKDRRLIDRYAERSNLKVIVGGSQAPALAENGRLVDICITEPEAVGERIAGMMLDYEAHDGRSFEQTYDFLKEFSALVRASGKQAILYTNPLDGPAQRHSGISPETAVELLPLFDQMSILLWHGNRQGSIAESAKSQLAHLKTSANYDPRKIYVIFEIRDTSLDDAKAVHNLILDERLMGIMLWRHGAQLGGGCGSEINRKIACVLFSACAAP